MMKRQLLFMLCLLLSATYAKADPVTAEQARQKAAQFLQGQVKAGARRRAPAAKQLRMVSKGRDDTYFIFNSATRGDGYVVVSGDDATESILGYSDTGTVDPDNMPCGMRVLLDGYADQIKFLRKNGITREQNSRKKTSRKASSIPYSYTISEDRRSYFDQDSPYNDSCHVINGKPALTGCTATAMAGLMYAHKWPKATIKEIPSYRNWDLNSLFTADWEIVEGAPAKTKIDWKNIENRYNGNESKEKKAAIATLMRLASISVKTTYVSNEEEEYGEANFKDDVDEALKKFFAYDESTMWAERKANERKGVDWELELKLELLRNGPVLYSGENKTSGSYPKGKHTYLLEGFKGNYFIVNFGWSGQHHDETYLLSVIEGEDNDKLIAYNSDQSAIFYVHPIPHVELEVTNLTLDNGSLTDCNFIDSKLLGDITFHNKGEGQSLKSIFLQLHDVETGKWAQRIVLKNLSPNEYYTYRFTFSNLTIGHRYVLKAYDIFGDEFYCSPEFDCIDDPAFNTDEELSGNETLSLFEYWFDNDFEGRRQKTLSSRKAVLTGSINTSHLDDGFHTLYYRVQRDDGEYSAISKSTFMKLTREQESFFDYWIDDDEENKQRIPLEDTEDEQLLTLDLSDDARIPVGYHRLNYRVGVAGSIVSPVQTQGVLKLSKGDAGLLEYWYDDDFAGRQQLTGRRSETGGFIFVNELDMSQLPVGVHRLNLRAVSSSGMTNGSVLTRTVVKMSTAVASKLEYWFDDDMANSILLDGQAAEGGFLFDYNLDLSQLSVGLHKLNFRATAASGYNPSPITSCTVMKLPSGNVTQLEYWFDGDRAHKRVLNVKEAGEANWLFASKLNISGIAPGHHRLYYRAIGSDKQVSTAVGTAAIMVKSQFRAEDGDALLTTYRIEVDNGAIVGYGQLNGKKEQLFKYTLDASALPPGNHTLRASFWNSYGAGITELVPFIVALGKEIGDANGDGKVDIADVTAIINIINGASSGSFNTQGADVNKDGKIDIGDVTGVINIINQ